MKHLFKCGDQIDIAQRGEHADLALAQIRLGIDGQKAMHVCVVVDDLLSTIHNQSCVMGMVHKLLHERIEPADRLLVDDIVAAVAHQTIDFQLAIGRPHRNRHAFDIDGRAIAPLYPKPDWPRASGSQGLLKVGGKPGPLLALIAFDQIRHRFANNAHLTGLAGGNARPPANRLIHGIELPVGYAKRFQQPNQDRRLYGGPAHFTCGYYLVHLHYPI